MYITEDGMRLNIKIDKPECEKCPLVIVIHGFTGHMEEDHKKLNGCTQMLSWC